jgi:hypothetical protein
MSRSFEIAEPTRNLRRLLLLFTVVPVLIVLLVLYAFMKPAPPPIMPLFLLAIIIVQNLAIGRWIERRQVTLEGAVLEVQAGIGKQRVAVAEIDLEHARVLGLDEHPEWRPFVKTGGFGMPGISLGGFRTRNLTRIYCVLTDRQRVLLLPLRGKKEALLLSLRRPDELLSALRSVDDSSRVRR